MLARIALVVTVCVVVSSAKNCAPPQWSASLMGKVAQVVKGKSETIAVSGKVYTDYDKKMELLTQNVTTGNTTTSVHSITDWNMLVTYLAYPEYRRCEAISVSPDDAAKFKPVCLDDADVKFIANLTIGGEAARMIEVARSSFNSSTKMTLVGDNFSPVTSVTLQNFDGIPQVLAFQYGNVSNSLDGVTISVPDYCKKNHTVRNRTCVPDQYEAVGLGIIAQSSQGQALALPMVMKQSRDFRNKMEAYESTITYKGTVIRSTTIIDYNKNKQYLMNPDAKTCNVSSAPMKEMTEYCSDNKDLNLTASFTVGGKPAATYDFFFSETRRQRISLTVFQDTFIPISSIVEQMNDMTAVQYGNVTRGIMDRSVFTVPSYCDREPVIG